jgi:hypothetical protein
MRVAAWQRLRLTVKSGQAQMARLFAELPEQRSAIEAGTHQSHLYGLVRERSVLIRNLVFV